MCGRFQLAATRAQVEDAIKVFDLDDFPFRYNIAPTQPVQMVVAAGPRAPGSNLPDRRGMLVRWGFIPGWAKDVKDFPLLINARSETAAEKSTFRAAMRHRRTLVPATGFYEWRRDGAKRPQAFWLRPRNGGIVAFAGLMETYSEPGGSEIDTGAILTTAASGDLEHIHHRMPVVVRPEHFTRWLDCVGNEPRDVGDLLRPAEPGFFEAVPISDKVNKVANTGPDILERVEERPSHEAVPREPDAQLTLF
ncbi:SOS response-associated peptidase [Nitratireductor thuwali]|uniref:Abasic site processing protein n=1 Tax=Nitratireductor thuwali TaxID=2267699 RepID=A0ABY5MM09_9HYPH|nr:Putative SOS response-associated peptidase YedK [Nitratireductor thuwali]